jgi:FAD/FMN-containing dehydrogenase
LELDHKPCQSLLAVEFFDDVEDRLGALRRMHLGMRTQIIRSLAEANQVWALRKAGLSLLTSRKGGAKPATCIEDVAIHPARLPEYVGALHSILAPLGLQASFYGHAASGLLHVRPILDLHRTDDVRKMRQLADEVAALVRIFKGSLAGEHGVGIARTEYLQGQVGANLMGVMREIKSAFDPHNLLNPVKLSLTVDTIWILTSGSRPGAHLSFLYTGAGLRGA